MCLVLLGMSRQCIRLCICSTCVFVFFCAFTMCVFVVACVDDFFCVRLFIFVRVFLSVYMTVSPSLTRSGEVPSHILVNPRVTFCKP